ncbi:MFS transporter [Pontibacter qinzhouensis]|uniref:MFS transporter n=1 Tax=Pontibacter qinzhouensis TaxID=2603253 RepID=A0A5C8IYT2_9BACT|nr:MFS transporter [Pontibacter qinzhouensis]TXK26204.1 MFS transporter [Pontibacter qinzhouensis]
MLSNISTTTYSRSTYRKAVGALFFLQGICFASWGSRIPTIQQNLGLSETQLGMVLFALPVGQMLSLPFTGWLISKIGSYRIVLGSAALYAAVLVVVGAAPTLWLLVLALFFFGILANMVNIAVNTQAVGVESLYDKPIMASFHGLWSLAGFTGAAVGAYMIGNGIVPLQHFLIVMVVTMAGIALSSKFALKQDVNVDPDQPIFVKPDKSLISLGLLAFCSLICEGAMFDWSGVYFKKVVMAEKAWIGAGYTAFMCTMASGRFMADRVASRIGLRKILQASGILIALGLLIAVVFPYLWSSILGFLLVGFGVSSVVPLVYSAAGKSKVMSPGMALAAVSTIGFLGFLLGPPVIGLVAGASSLRLSFTIIAVMGLCVTIVATRTKSL